MAAPPVGNGAFEGKKVVSPENLDATRIAKVGISDHRAYALGWFIEHMLNGAIFWHNGGTPAFGAVAAFEPNRKVGIVILTNETLVGMPDWSGCAGARPDHGQSGRRLCRHVA